MLSDDETSKPLVFMSYARPDREQVLTFYSSLRSSLYDLWLDVQRIMGGQNWEFEIKKALDKSSIILAFVSENSIDRRGYVQKELRLALDKFDEKLVDDIFIIPIMLDRSSIPDRIKGFHALFASDENIIENIRESIAEQLRRLGSAIDRSQELTRVEWSYTRHKEAWEGLPGYDCSCQFISLSSEEYPHVENLNSIIKGHFYIDIMNSRSVMFRQNNDLNFGKDKFLRTDAYDATCTNVSIVERFISIEYTIHTFGAGAAHGMTHFKTFNAMLFPLIMIPEVKYLFNDPDVALVDLQIVIREGLLQMTFHDAGEDEIRLQEDWVSLGIAEWSNLAAFIFSQKGLTIIFPPYAVAPYAFGPLRVDVPWRKIRHLMKTHILCSLGREFEHFEEKTEEEQRAARVSIGSDQ